MNSEVASFWENQFSLGVALGILTSAWPNKNFKMTQSWEYLGRWRWMDTEVKGKK